jgi:hypothetical protein
MTCETETQGKQDMPNLKTPFMDQILDVLRYYMNDPSSSFSIGSFGAIAEFHRDMEEELALNDTHPHLTIATERGALRVTPSTNMRPLAYESLSNRKNCWQQGVVFCLPQAEAQSHRRNVLTELGTDHEAIRETDKKAILFDMGLAAVNCDFCIRTADEELIKTLRQHDGKSVLDPDNPVMGAIVKNSPHRIAISKLGRLEVFQSIGQEKTPEGPHTHVLPKFLKSGRTHSANIPVPSGFIPCLSLYPASPMFDSLGNEKDFDQAACDAFDRLLSFWGNREYIKEKYRLINALKEQIPPETYLQPECRLGRTGLRIALRQQFRKSPDDSRLQIWQRMYDNSQID